MGRPGRDVDWARVCPNGANHEARQGLRGDRVDGVVLVAAPARMSHVIGESRQSGSPFHQCDEVRLRVVSARRSSGEEPTTVPRRGSAHRRRRCRGRRRGRTSDAGQPDPVRVNGIGTPLQVTTCRPSTKPARGDLDPLDGGRRSAPCRRWSPPRPGRCHGSIACRSSRWTPAIPASHRGGGSGTRGTGRAGLVELARCPSRVHAVCRAASHRLMSPTTSRRSAAAAG